MTEPSDNRIRLTIVGGYLGSGKTTWLRHQLHESAFEKSHIIINEAAEIPVDNALLFGTARLSVLSGGCACCEGKHNLVRELRRLCDQRSGSQDTARRIDQIILETSGLADPAAIVSMIQSDTILIRQIVIRQTIVVADTVNLLEQMRDDTLGRTQIEAADKIVLTKTDLVESGHFFRVAASLAVVNPAAVFSSAIFGAEVKLPSIPAHIRPYQLPDLSAQVRLPINAVHLDLGSTPDWTAFTVWLSALLHCRGKQIVRVKGIIRTPAGLLLLQAVRTVVQSPEIVPAYNIEPSLQNKIAVIGHGFKKRDIRSSLNHFCG